MLRAIIKSIPFVFSFFVMKSNIHWIGSIPYWIKVAMYDKASVQTIEDVISVPILTEHKVVFKAMSTTKNKVIGTKQQGRFSNPKSICT